jgi:xanthine dehydrogenase large subunit
MTVEEILWDERGRLLADSLSKYKIPDIFAAPKVIEIRPLDTKGPKLALLRSKAVGEPPFMYGIGVFFALQNAIKAFNPEYRPEYNSPLTPEKVLMLLYPKKNK